MKKTKLLALLLAFLMLFSSVGVFAEETTQENTQTSYQLSDEAITLRDNIAEVLKDVEDGWTAFDMAAYSALPDATVTTSDGIKQAVINACIDTAASSGATVSDRARVEIVLKSLGIDSKELYTYNSNELVNNATALLGADHTASGHYAAPWILLADMQGNLNLSDAQKDALIAILQQNSAGGTFGYEWDGVQYPDPDTAAATLAALAPLYETNEAAKELCDEILAAFDSMISESGSFGSANSDAFVIIGLIAMGNNPADMRHPVSGASVIDGLLSYKNELNNGFAFAGNDNFMATEQGFRALVALSQYKGQAFNIYDFSDKEVIPGRQQIAEETPGSDTPGVPEINKITVVFSIKPESTYWIESMLVEIPENGTVYDAFCAVLEAVDGISATGAENGYITSITKDGTTMSAGSCGANSGWMYSVNGETPEVGMKNCVLTENDEILWYYYSEKTTTNTGGSILGGWGSGYGGGSSNTKPAKPVKPETPETPETPEVSETPEIPAFNDVINHWSKEAVEYVAKKGIMNGVGEGEFAPDKKLTRAMLVTMLYRLSGDTADGKNEFSDIADGVWYKDAATWAKNKGISNGYGNGIFGADDEVTREQLVVMLMRYAELKQVDTTMGEGEFIDGKEISDWAKVATYWAKNQGIVSGREDGSFDPSSGATRGEIAAVFMRFCENVLK